MLVMPERPHPDPRISLIAAVARNGAIGAKGQLLWREPEDQRHFRQRTMGCPVLMGRRTWESLPDRFRPLPGRRNLVLSTQVGWEASGAERYGSLDAALASLDPSVSRAFVIGGAQVYARALPFADELVLTEIDADFDADTYFPAWDRSLFEVSDRSELALSASGAGYRFVTYRRRR